MLISDVHIIGNKLLTFRKQKGLTQAEVAELAEISDRTYADIERGSTNMRMETLVGICKALNITPNQILIDDDNSLMIEQEKLFKQLNSCKTKERETALKLLSVYLNSI
ncbi:MAG: helix-turn-helix domain-containing protein [Acutalibacteraceae bacterium]